MWKREEYHGVSKEQISNVFAEGTLGRSMGTEDAEVGGGQIKEGEKKTLLIV